MMNKDVYKKNKKNKSQIITIVYYAKWQHKYILYIKYIHSKTHKTNLKNIKQHYTDTVGYTIMELIGSMLIFKIRHKQSTKTQPD